MEQFFSFNGRVRRMTFWINTLICGVANFIIGLMFVDVQFTFYEGEQYVISNKPVYYLLTGVVVVRALSVIVRRWHDLDKSGWLAMLSFYFVLSGLFPNLMFYSSAALFLTLVGGVCALVLLGFLGFVPGDEGANGHGPAPEEGQWI